MKMLITNIRLKGNHTSILKISSENIDRQLSYILFGKLLSKIPFLACFNRNLVQLILPITENLSLKRK